MKNIFKKLTVFILAMFMATSFTACGGGGSIDGGGKTNKGTLKILAFEGGYGIEWLEKIGAAYQANTGTKVKVETTTTYTYVDQQLKGNTYVGDLVFNITNNTKSGAQGKYKTLDDVFSANATGENKTVAEKLGAIADDFKFDGHYYQMPYESGKTGLLVNMTSLNKLFPNGYELPITTKGLLKMCDDIKNNTVKGWSFVHTNSVDAEYYIYLRDMLAIQYMGLDAFDAYFDGCYIDEYGEKIFADNADELLTRWHDAWESALSVCSSIANTDNGYTPLSCKSMDFMYAQAYFWGVTAETDYRPTVFMVNGDWYYSESDYLAEEKAADIRMMKVPVNSDIINVLDTVNSEEQLVECVKYVDKVLAGTTAEKPSYLSEQDEARLTEARSMIFDTHCQHTASIPFNTRNEDAAKDFLKFFATDAACRIYSKYMGGYTSPYNPEIYDQGALNNFTRSVNTISENALLITGRSTKMTILGGLPLFKYNYFNADLNKGKAVDLILSESENAIRTNWDSWKQLAGN